MLEKYEDKDIYYKKIGYGYCVEFFIRNTVICM